MLVQIDDKIVETEIFDRNFVCNLSACKGAYFDEHGIAKCAFEKAFQEGKTKFKKPLSCHLYPIRTKSFDSGKVIGLNYDEWEICDPVCKLGNELQVPTYKFLKEPLIRAFGEHFYDELETVAEEWKKKN